MLYACVQRLDVMENLEKFCKILETKQALCIAHVFGTQDLSNPFLWKVSFTHAF